MAELREEGRGGDAGPTDQVVPVEAVFVLRQIVAGLPHWAKVSVEVEPADQDEVAVSPQAFDWLRDVYGPRAVVDRRVNHQLVTEASAGARYALAHVRGRIGASRVTLTMIKDSPVDTCDGDVTLAAAHAVAAALDGQLEPAPYLAAHGAVFDCPAPSGCRLPASSRCCCGGCSGEASADTPRTG
ncbi:hypothetical protein [Micromonospora arborensis]|uniref:hypothetical protein n=1 Tax=Micromonospora arborensis TaxID=2116518 RepID=UPI0011B6F5AF|nr:hypothetical protein [Micromonospora arborensis]